MANCLQTQKIVGVIKRYLVGGQMLLALCGVFPTLADDVSRTEQIEHARIFTQPLAWVGGLPPSDADSAKLLAVIALFKSAGITDGLQGLEQFVENYPNSSWTPSLEVNLAEYDRNHGRYSLALSYWESAWNATKGNQDDRSKKLAVRAMAGWTRLLASLGEKDKLDTLFKELGDSKLSLGRYATMINETKEGLSVMKAKPGVAYRCGSFALGHMAMALNMNQDVVLKVFKTDSPDGGFRMSQLLNLAQSNGISVVAVRRPVGAEIVVPSVVHWKLNHYAAITAKKGNLYRVVDPTFERQVWMDVATIDAEASGEFIVPKAKAPKDWQELSSAECANIYGKGDPGAIPDQEDTGPSGCPPNSSDDSEDSDNDPPAADDGIGGQGVPSSPPSCHDCGMPQWSVSEPYITLWLKDAPLLYRQSSGRWMNLHLSYKGRMTQDEIPDSSVGGFGDKWSCNWLGKLTQGTNTDAMTDHLAGGGLLTYATDGTLGYKCIQHLEMLKARGLYVPEPALVLASEAFNSYGLSLVNGVGDTNYFITQRVDRYGRTLEQFNYKTSGGLTLVTNVVDMDGRTNTLAYTNSSFPNLITSVTDPYGRTARFFYNGDGLLTNIVDAQGMSTCFQYDSNEDITNMVTLYGTNSFQSFDGTNSAGTMRRSLLITEANGGQQLYAYSASGIGDDYNVSSYHWNRAQYAEIPAADKVNLLDMPSADYTLASINSWLKYWPGGVESASDTLFASSPAGSPRCCTYYTYQGGGPGYAGALKMVTQIDPPAGSGASQLKIDRNSLGRPLVYTHYNSDSSFATYSNYFDASGTILQKEIGPRGELIRGYGYDPVITNLLVSVTNAENDVIRYTHEPGTLKVTSITFPSGMVRTNIYYTSGPSKGFLAIQIDEGFRTNSFAYTNGNVWMQTNELGLVTTYTYDKLNRLISTAYPDNTTISNFYDKLDIVATKDRLNQWTHYGYNQVRQLMAETNVEGQITTYDYCGCGSPDAVTRWNGSTALTTFYYYDIAGRITNTVYADNYQLFYSYNDRSLINQVRDGAGHQLDVGYVNFGLDSRVGNIAFGGTQLLYRQFDEYGRIVWDQNRYGAWTTNDYDFLDRMIARQSFGGADETGLETFSYNDRGLTNYVDALGHPTTYVRDALGRVMYQTNANNEVLRFTYNPADELLSLTDGKNQTTHWNYDIYARLTNKVDNANNEIFRYKYDPLDRLTNRWSIAKGTTVYRYDPIGNLTNVDYSGGSSYTPAISYTYDPFNRLTNMVDAVGTTTFSWTDGDQLKSEKGPWDSDTVTYTYDAGHQRSLLSLSQPNISPWNQRYIYDQMMRLTNVNSQAGNFTYEYNYSGSDIADRIHYDDNWTVYLQSSFDSLMRESERILATPFGSVVDMKYHYDAGSQITQQVFTAGNFIDYTYDKIGQLKTAQGYDTPYYDNALNDYVTTTRLQEQFGYAYDKAWNLSRRTNNALVQIFGVNSLNELTNSTRAGTLTVAGNANETKGGTWDGYEWYWLGSPYGVTNVTVSGTGLSSGLAEIYADGSWARTNATLADGNNNYTAVALDSYGRSDTKSVTTYVPATVNYSYDLNGNLLSDGTRNFAYDDENQLVSVWKTSMWREDFVYDGLLRRRITRQYDWNGSSWVQTNEVRYVYDGNLVVQERDGDNAPLVAYTRGDDLSHSLQGAGGIGGLLARTDMKQRVAGSAFATAYYLSDGQGNIANLVYTNGAVAAAYHYDPYGNLLSMSGPLAEVNHYRFSSKEWDATAGLDYYLYRFYDPNLQRWLNRDPIQEAGGINLYEYCLNRPLWLVDYNGLSVGVAVWPILADTGGGGIAVSGGGVIGLPVGIGIGGILVGPILFPPHNPNLPTYPPTYPGQVNAPPLSVPQPAPTQCESKGHGERGIQGNDPNPWKGYRPRDPANPSKGGLKRDPQTGKWKPVPRPPGPPPPNHPTW